jgi:hypothetical protein
MTKNSRTSLDTKFWREISKSKNKLSTNMCTAEKTSRNSNLPNWKNETTRYQNNNQPTIPIDVKARWSRAVDGFWSRKMSYRQRRMGVTAAVGWMVVPNGDFLGGMFYAYTAIAHRLLMYCPSARWKSARRKCTMKICGRSAISGRAANIIVCVRGCVWEIVYQEFSAVN